MREHRVDLAHLEQRFRACQTEEERVWGAAQAQSGLSEEQYRELVGRIGRRVTWNLWVLAMQEAVALMEDVAGQPEGGVWMCSMCKRRMVGLVPDAGIEELLETA